ncbi:MAG: plastocyanin/azurin family copper-binding protein, partial [Acidimicrobiia bacterium]
MRRLAIMVSVLAAVTGTGIPTATPEQPPAAVSLQNKLFEPKDLTIQAGEQVTWTNNDGVDHTVTDDNDGFDSNPSCGETLGYCMEPN